MADNEELPAKEQQPVNIFIAEGNMQAEMILSVKKSIFQSCQNKDGCQGTATVINYFKNASGVLTAGRAEIRTGKCQQADPDLAPGFVSECGKQSRETGGEHSCVTDLQQMQIKR